MNFNVAASEIGCNPSCHPVQAGWRRLARHFLWQAGSFWRIIHLPILPQVNLQDRIHGPDDRQESALVNYHYGAKGVFAA
ncbi:MAG TPA: hypothetical protein PK878_19960 [bacterium]|nr:hypothetical protein [bacterium]HPO99012.1 hypothetical protein [bacterium]HXK94973.1 hypothetical protein [bacterium]